ncbi:MAG: NAD(P)/FAD-dependent oxidoreductase [Promethearchaeota archaeon]
MKQLKCEVLVIGAGPAGLTAALYLKRAKVDVLVISGKYKSALALAHVIDNYPGTPAISGTELLDIMTGQVKDLGVEFLYDDVIALSLTMKPKMVSTKEALVTADAIVIANGKGARKPELEREEEFIGLGVSYCAVCDGPLYRQKNVCIIGMDEEAAEDVLVLDQMGCKVTWLLKGKFLKDVDVKQGVLNEIKEKNIPMIENATKLKILSDDDRVTGIEYDNEHGTRTSIDVDCAFVLTSIPTATLIEKAGCKVSDRNAVVTNYEQETNIDGVFACGDICGKGFQVSIAVGEGAVAGLNAAKFIRKHRKD